MKNAFDEIWNGTNISANLVNDLSKCDKMFDLNMFSCCDSLINFVLNDWNERSPHDTKLKCGTNSNGRADHVQRDFGGCARIAIYDTNSMGLV